MVETKSISKREKGGMMDVCQKDVDKKVLQACYRELRRQTRLLARAVQSIGKEIRRKRGGDQTLVLELISILSYLSEDLYCLSCTLDHWDDARAASAMLKLKQLAADAAMFSKRYKELPALQAALRRSIPHLSKINKMLV